MIPKYKTEKGLYRSGRTLIYRALRDSDQTGVIIKTLNSEYPSNRDLARFKQQLRHVASIKDGPKVISSDNDADQLQTAQPLTAIVAPIKLQNQVIGAMEFHDTSADQQRQFTDQEAAFVQAVADQVAQTAENLRLFDETRQRAALEAGQKLTVPYTLFELGIEVNGDINDNELATKEE